MTKGLVITTSDAAYMIHDAIGPLRNWHTILDDMRLNRGDYCELVLTPIGIAKHEKSKRPVYLLSDVQKFIDEARVRSGSKVSPRSINPFPVEYDPSDKRKWNERKLQLFS
ncbi:hypothetical protein QMS78_06355 [Cronobacter dublinensis]|uniref:hypothetical protein n=1 Tax=Enterobacteriaceae TaxID=543 RepID=UPI00175A621C|nr:MULTISPECIES: hypothetical protein [Enterobacteriaceae]EKS6930794.1 hypothetical protein [Enterobacter bugandensis]HAI5185416.1 hypothetical protein [Escherichia coli]EHJ4099560.1 hypothetical protein [Escherichia fergusonii]EKS6932710.1 hypothetical protein [Enterobacter bugandensis]EKV5173623.1 hypothetical protein [Enterobacter bugandensis]